MSEPVLCTEFPAPGLRNPNRYITGHDADGKAVFLQVRCLAKTECDVIAEQR